MSLAVVDFLCWDGLCWDTRFSLGMLYRRGEAFAILEFNEAQPCHLDGSHILGYSFSFHLSFVQVAIFHGRKVVPSRFSLQSYNRMDPLVKAGLLVLSHASGSDLLSLESHH